MCQIENADTFLLCDDVASETILCQETLESACIKKFTEGKGGNTRNKRRFMEQFAASHCLPWVTLWWMSAQVSKRLFMKKSLVRRIFAESSYEILDCPTFYHLSYGNIPSRTCLRTPGKFYAKYSSISCPYSEDFLINSFSPTFAPQSWSPLVS